jgi:hypothetical protein
MSRRTTVFLILAIVALLIAAAGRFVPQVGIPADTADFIGGLGVGLLIGFIFGWIGDTKS